MPTILDVAAKAGVSRSTVSRVLTNSKRVDPETKLKVLAAMKELNYQPSQAARNLRKQETNLIAALIPSILQYGPIVLSNEYTENDSLPAVVIDNIKAAEQAIEYLLSKGHSRIGFINGVVKCFFY